MNLTALTCMYQKPIPVMRAVLEAIKAADETIVVLDRPSPEELIAVAGQGRVIQLTGPPGWRSPCLSWNAGLKHITGDHLLILQGDVELHEESIPWVRQALEQQPAVYFGQVLESNPELCTGPGHAGPILQGAANPRPMTYLLTAPTAAIQATGGWDEAFQAGVWYEDDDFIARLWKTSKLPFIFDDHLRAVHHSHDRGYSLPIRISTNMRIMLEKHGTATFFKREGAQGHIARITGPGRTEWRYVDNRNQSA